MNRVTNRALVVATALAAVAAMGSAGTADADPGALSGRYAVTGGDDQIYVTATSNCATDGCTATLVSNLGWTSVATKSGGRWNFDVVKPDGVICSDGNFADVVIRYSVDAGTMTGNVLADSNGECPGGQVTQSAFRMTKLG
ncbi:MAG: hypothetical protein KDB50_08530 [Mycobacterium sp.]|nr:hypothetical protein [Mycobacterium sp.]